MKTNNNTIPPINPRRPYEDDKPKGYLESFADYTDGNRMAVEWFLENYDTVKTAVNAHTELKANCERLLTWAETYAREIMIDANKETGPLATDIQQARNLLKSL